MKNKRQAKFASFKEKYILFVLKAYLPVPFYHHAEYPLTVATSGFS